MDIINAPAVPDDISTIATVSGLKPFLDHAKLMAKKALTEVHDVNTKKGRTAIGGLAKTISSSKTAIAVPGAVYVKDLKQSGVNAAELFKEFGIDMDAIRDEIKKPVDEWKAKDQTRISRIQDLMNEVDDIYSDGTDNQSSHCIQEVRDHLAKRNMNQTLYHEFHEEAMDIWCKKIEFLDQQIKVKKYEELLAANNEKLLLKNAELEKQAEIEREVNRRTVQAEADANQKIKDAENSVKDAEDAVRKQLMADQEREAAERDEITRLAKEKSEDKDHRAAINNEALNSLMEAVPGLTNVMAKQIVIAAAKNLLKNITINY